MYQIQSNHQEGGQQAMDTGQESLGSSMAPPQFRLDASSGDAPVQAKVTREVDNVNHVLNFNSNGDVKGFLGILDDKVQEAYRYVLQVPALDTFADLDGHCQKWAEVTYPAILRGDLSGNIAADFGYVVESIACFNLPKTHSSMTVGLQEVRPGTRPDVVLSQNSQDIAWLDITAHKSAGHIDGKVGWYEAGNCSYAGEVTYPSLDQGAINLMVHNKDKKTSDVMDASALEEKLREQARLNEVREERWANIGEEIAFIAAGEMGKGRAVELDAFKFIRQQIVVADIVIGMFGLPIAHQIRKWMEQIFKEVNYDFDALNKFMNANFPENMELIARLPSILTAMGLNPSTYGFSGSVSRATGKAWLMENDPNLPTRVD